MSRAPIDGNAATAQLASLYRARCARTEPLVAREAAQAAEALATTLRGWTTFLPRPAALQEARSTVAGLGNLLAELAALQQGGPPDAAA